MMSKSYHFSYGGMVARSQLAAIDLNLNCSLSQAKARKGENCFAIRRLLLTGHQNQSLRKSLVHLVLWKSYQKRKFYLKGINFCEY